MDDDREKGPASGAFLMVSYDQRDRHRETRFEIVEERKKML